MRTSARFIVGLMLLVLAAPVAAAPLNAPAAGRVYNLTATLTGAAEGKTPGAPNGSGTADVTLDPNTGKVCFTIQVAGITLPAVAAHIHKGAAGVAGPIVIGLKPPTAGGVVKDCVTADAAMITEVGTHPADYYVNVHTPDFPGGAVRGQLSEGQAMQMPSTGAPAQTTGLLLMLALLFVVAGGVLRREMLHRR